jgi:hypothetical protein
MIQLKMLQMQGAKFPRNEAYLVYVAMMRKLKQRSRWGIFSGIIYVISSSCLTRKEKDRTEGLEAERTLVALPDFKSGAPGEEPGGWVRFPCASAI